MPEILIRCPITGLQVSTGIVLSRKVFDKMIFDKRRVGCPHCGQPHVWGRREAYLSS